MALVFLRETEKIVLKDKLLIFFIIIVDIFLKNFFYNYISIIFSVVAIGVLIFKLKINKNFIINIVLVSLFYIGRIQMNDKMIYYGLFILIIYQILIVLKTRKNYIFAIIPIIIVVLFKNLEYNSFELFIFLLNFSVCNLFLTLKNKTIDEYLNVSPKVLMFVVLIYFIILNINLNANDVPFKNLYLKNIALPIFYVFLDIFIFSLLENLEYGIKITSNTKIQILKNIVWLILLGISIYFFPIILVALWPLIYLLDPLFKNINICYTYVILFFLTSIFLVWIVVFFKEKAKIIDYIIFLIYFLIIGYGFFKTSINIETFGVIKAYLTIISIVILTKFLIFSVKYLFSYKNY